MGRGVHCGSVIGVQDAIAFYHGLLSDELAEASQTMLDDQLRRRGLVFGERPLATVLRPRFMALAHYRRLQRRVRLLMRAFRKAYERAVTNAGFRAQFRLTEWEEQLVRHEPGFHAPSPTSRHRSRVAGSRRPPRRRHASRSSRACVSRATAGTSRDPANPFSV